MKKIIFPLLICLLFTTVVGCGDDKTQDVSSVASVSSVSSQVASSQPEQTVQKSEIELVLQKDVWQPVGESYYLVFFNNQSVVLYDFSALDGVTQDVGKYLSYALGHDEQGAQTVTVDFLTGSEQRTVFLFNEETKEFATAEESPLVLNTVSMKTFVDGFISQIEAVEKQGEDTWQSQSEINQGMGILCCYWNALYQMVNSHLEATLTTQQFQTVAAENKTFVSTRESAMQQAGKDVEGGTTYPMVTGGVYCSQTKNYIQTLMTNYMK